MIAAAALEIIERYENGIGRDENARVARRTPEGVLKSTPEHDEVSVNAYAQRCAEYLEYADEVAKAKLVQLPSSEAIMVCRRSPKILIELGLADLPMLHTQKHFMLEISRKSAYDDRKHGLEFNQMLRLPEMLESPLAVADTLSRNNPNALVVFLEEVDHDGYPLIAVIRPDGFGQHDRKIIATNFVDSVYGRGRADSASEQTTAYLDRAAQCGKLLFVDREKTERFLMRERLQLPNSIRNLNGIIQMSNYARNRGTQTSPSTDREMMDMSNMAGAISARTGGRWRVATLRKDEREPTDS